MKEEEEEEEVEEEEEEEEEEAFPRGAKAQCIPVSLCCAVPHQGEPSLCWFWALTSRISIYNYYPE